MIQVGVAVSGLEDANPDYISSAWQNLGSARVMARTLASTFPIEHQLALARGFGVHLIEAWWRGLTHNDTVPQALRAPLQLFETRDRPESAATLSETIGRAAANFDAETAAYQIGLTYTGMLPTQHRGLYGIFYTPPSLTGRLIDQPVGAD